MVSTGSRFFRDSWALSQAQGQPFPSQPLPTHGCLGLGPAFLGANTNSDTHSRSPPPGSKLQAPFQSTCPEALEPATGLAPPRLLGIVVRTPFPAHMHFRVRPEAQPLSPPHTHSPSPGSDARSCSAPRPFPGSPRAALRIPRWGGDRTSVTGVRRVQNRGTCLLLRARPGHLRLGQACPGRRAQRRRGWCARGIAQAGSWNRGCGWAIWGLRGRPFSLRSPKLEVLVLAPPVPDRALRACACAVAGGALVWGLGMLRWMEDQR